MIIHRQQPWRLLSCPGGGLEATTNEKLLCGGGHPHVLKAMARPMAEFPTPMAEFSRSRIVAKKVPGPIDKFTALMGTTFVTIPVFMSRGQKLTPAPKNVVATKLFAPKFCAD